VTGQVSAVLSTALNELGHVMDTMDLMPGHENTCEEMHTLNHARALRMRGINLKSDRARPRPYDRPLS